MPENMSCCTIPDALPFWKNPDPSCPPIVLLLLLFLARLSALKSLLFVRKFGDRAHGGICWNGRGITAAGIGAEPIVIECSRDPGTARPSKLSDPEAK